MPDLGQLCRKYGSDLQSVPSDWFLPDVASSLLRRRGICLSKQRQFLCEVFAGCANLTQAARSAGMEVCPPVDIKIKFGSGQPAIAGQPQPAFGGAPGLDLLKAEDRRLVWSMLVTGKPLWVHAAFPCTFWSPMAHFNRRRAPESDEESRLESLVFVVFALQLVRYQRRTGAHASFEQPPACMSWHLDIVKDTMQEAGMSRVVTDLCCWGAVDPGNGLPYKKPMALCSTFDLHQLGARCRGRHAVRQKVHQNVDSGPRRGTPRAQISGEYPPLLCCEWVRAAAAFVQPLA